MPIDLGALLQTSLGEQFTVERELRHGGMSRVFLVHERELGRRVVYKVLRPELAADVDADRFRREIRILARLNHPHLVPIHAAGKQGGLLYFSMPFVEGETLRERLERERPLPLDDALRLGAEMADALDYAHRNGVIHRDIKPDNVLLADEHAIIADFGVARAIDAAAGERITLTGITLGTPAYMSPEQAAGDSTVDGRSDVYALGCVMFEMLAGTPPFTGPTAQVIIARRFNEAAPPLSRVRAGIPDIVDRLVRRALEREPKDRWATGGYCGVALAAARRALAVGSNESQVDPSATIVPRSTTRGAGATGSGGESRMPPAPSAMNDPQNDDATRRGKWRLW